MNGVFLDDDWSNTGGAAENCVLNDCQHDMGLSTRDVADITDGWCNMMKQTQATILDKGGFDWRMFSPGSGTCSGPPFAAGELTEGIEGAAGLLTCTEYMRQECSSGPNSTLQESAMMYGMGKGCSLVTDKATGYPVDFEQHLASFLVLRGPYAWLGWAWVGCSGNRGKGSGSVPLPPTPKEMFATDYGTPTGICKETAASLPIAHIRARSFSLLRVPMLSLSSPPPSLSLPLFLYTGSLRMLLPGSVRIYLPAPW